MNKVVTINLNGTAFQLEEAAYDALRAYLDNAARQLGANPDKDEIIADIEQAIGDKCRAVLSPHKNVVIVREIAEIIASMGPVDDGSASAANSDSAASSTGPSATSGSTGATGSATAGTASHPPPPQVRRLYRLYEGAMISGVCNGIAVYAGVDPTLIRAVFVLAACLTLGGAAVAYLVLAIVLPAAHTPEEKASAHGTPSTAQEFIRRARDGYYQAAKNWGDRSARREWKRRFRQDMRAWKAQFRANMTRGAASWTPPPVTPPPPSPHPDWPLWIGAPFAGFLKAILTLIAVLAVISLLTSHKLFTFALPTDVPVWVAIVVVIIVYQILATPFHALRHAYRHGTWSGPHPLAAVFSMLASVFGVVLLAFTVWYLDRHVPEAHEFFHKIPPALRSLFEALRDWWTSL